MDLTMLGAGLSIGLAGLGVALGQGIMAKKSVEVLGKNPDLSNTLLVYTILGLALIETAAIYGLVMAFTIAGAEGLAAGAALGAGLGMGLTGFAAGLGEGLLISGAMEAILRNPDAKGKVLTFMILFAALIEVIAIYGIIITLQIVG